jgi:hypothetical protein
MERSLSHFLVFSALLHAACLGLTGLSFPPQPRPSLPELVFWGRLLTSPPTAAVTPSIARPALYDGRLFPPAQSMFTPGASGGAGVPPWVKPPAAPVLPRPEPGPFRAAPEAFEAGKDSSVMIHPLLPYQLQLYFKDRQSVHMELMFKIIPRPLGNHIVIKRKVSSGNLDADLLCCRYLGHYLFIQGARFAPNTWRTVKIDLSE